jgi:hypothetical protein
MEATVFASDWQFWNTYSIERNFDENWRVRLGKEFKFGYNTGRLFLIIFGIDKLKGVAHA